MAIRIAQSNEKGFLSTVIQYARQMGWMTYHTHNSLHSVKGFPDLVLVRERVVYAELKTEKGVLTESQKLWLDKLIAADQEVYLWRPSHWNLIQEVLGKE